MDKSGGTSFLKNRKKLQTVMKNLTRNGIGIFEYIPSEDRMLLYDAVQDSMVEKEGYLADLDNDLSVYPEDQMCIRDRNIDGSKLLSKYKIRSRFDDIALNIDQLSTGCKTVLNVFYYPDKVFCLKECGNNALEAIYGLEKAEVQASGRKRVIDDYEKLKEWWENEE